MRKFEFHAYAGDEHGAVAERANVTTKEFAERAQARAHAGRLAKQVNGPVDLARAFDPPEQPTRDWSSRYITTASPSEHHAAGYRFERLDS
jgi:hypothetical protein